MWLNNSNHQNNSLETKMRWTNEEKWIYFGARAFHNALGNNKHFVEYFGLFALSESNENDPKVGAAQVECKNVIGLVAGGQLRHIGGQHLHVRLAVRISAQSLLHFVLQYLHDLTQRLVAQLELVKSFLNLFK